jgi:site-specific recombinase XerD
VDDYDLIRRWQDEMLRRGETLETLHAYRYSLLKLATETSPAKPLTEMTEQDVVVFLTKLSRNAWNRRRYVEAFVAFFGWAYAEGHLDSDPSEHLSPPASRRPLFVSPAS